MLRASPKPTSLWAGTKHPNYPRKSDVSMRTVAAAISAAKTASPSVGDPRLQFLVHTCLVVDSRIGDVASRSGIIHLATDVGIDGLKTQIWSLIRSNKYAHDCIEWEDYSAKLVVRVKWMIGNVRVPDSVLETDAEVRTAIEFMAERGFQDMFSVTCYLTPNAKALEDDVEYPIEDEGVDTGSEANRGWNVDWYGPEKVSQRTETGPRGTSDEEEQVDGRLDW
jgi:hypothetical protein